MVGSMGALAACAVLALPPHPLAAPPTAILRPPPPCRTATAAMSLDSTAKHAGSGGAAGGDGADPTLAELWSLPTDEARRDAVTEMVRGWSGDGSKGERPFGFPPIVFPAEDAPIVPMCHRLSFDIPRSLSHQRSRLRLGSTRGTCRGVPWEAGRGERVLTHPIFRLPPPTCQTRCFLPMFLTRDVSFLGGGGRAAGRAGRSPEERGRGGGGNAEGRRYYRKRSGGHRSGG